ncbi:MAG: hypothetical protein HYT39_00880 [Candidatus Sungbacteria bacterium]|nr:hypothetical protein [Candidatus Sungbacteria bacterium]
MKITFYGTRGSTPVSNRNSQKYGGNTTCLRVESDCLPDGHWLVVDAGTGIVPLSWNFAKNGGKTATILQSHWHHDHTQGLALSAFPYMKHALLSIVGPYEHGFGPRRVYANLIMRSPVFPVNFREWASHINCYNIEFPSSNILLFHPRGGMSRVTVEQYERFSDDSGQMPFKKQKFPLGECLVVRMHKSHHPEYTISYRFEEKPTGKVFVFVTDHENEDGLPMSFRAHLASADLLVMDCQYTDKKYQEVTAGWGHATPSYVARVAKETGAKALGLTHHDPPSDDALVDGIVETAQRLLAEFGSSTRAFGCYDYMEIAV